MEARTWLKQLAIVALPLLVACHANEAVPSKTAAQISAFLSNYDRAINARQFTALVPMYAGGATITLKNRFIYELTKDGPQGPADKAAYDRIAAGKVVTPAEAFTPMAEEKTLGYTLSRSDIAVTRSGRPDAYDVQSKITEEFCDAGLCTTVHSDDRMIVAVSDGTVHILSEYQAVTALPTQAATRPTPASSP